MRITHAICLVFFAALIGPIANVRAQSQRGPYYNRTTTIRGGDDRAAVSGSETPSAATRFGIDPLRPYTNGTPTASSGNRHSSQPREPRAVAMPRPEPPLARNYYPTARFGQSPNRNVRSHCTPSRGGAFATRR